MSFKDKILKILKEVTKRIKELKIEEKLKKIYNYKYSNLIILFIIIFMFLCGLIYGNIKTSRDSVLSRLEKSLKNKDSKELIRLIKINDEKTKLNKKKIEPLIEYYNCDSTRIKELISSLEKNQEVNSLQLVQTNGFLRNKHFLYLTLRSLEIESNFENSKVYLNDELMGVTDSSGKIDLSNLIPGTYNLKVEKESKYSKLSKEEDIVISSNSKEKINLEGMLISVDSNFKDADVYIDGTKSGLKVHEFKNIGPFKTDGSIGLSLKIHTPWGELSSDNVYISKHPQLNINIDLKNEKIISDINNTINEFYNSVFESLNSKDKSLIVKGTKEVKDDIYSILMKKYFIIKNYYKIHDLQIKIENSEITVENGDYKGNIVVSVGYTVEKKILGISFQQKKYIENFFTKVRYNNGQWEVYKVNNFTLSGLE